MRSETYFALGATYHAIGTCAGTGDQLNSKGVHRDAPVSEFQWNPRSVLSHIDIVPLVTTPKRLE